MFDLPSDYRITPNFISMCIQPDEGIHLKFEAKVPGTSRTESVDMDFHYRSAFVDAILPDAYEHLLLDAMNGDASLFTRSNGIEASWRLIDPLIKLWEADSSSKPVLYDPGSWGPEEADTFIARDGRVWRMGCIHQQF